MSESIGARITPRLELGAAGTGLPGAFALQGMHAGFQLDASKYFGATDKMVRFGLSADARYNFRLTVDTENYGHAAHFFGAGLGPSLLIANEIVMSLKALAQCEHREDPMEPAQSGFAGGLHGLIAIDLDQASKKITTPLQLGIFTFIPNLTRPSEVAGGISIGYRFG